MDTLAPSSPAMAPSARPTPAVGRRRRAFWGRKAEDGPVKDIVQAAVRRHLWISLVILVAVGLPTALSLSAMARHWAVDEAIERSERLASTVVAPLLPDGGAGADRRQASADRVVLDAIVGARIADGTLHGVRVWDEVGGVVYAAGEAGPAHDSVGLPPTTTNTGQAVSHDAEHFHVLVQAGQPAGRALLVEVVLPYAEVVRLEDQLRWPAVAASMLGLLVLTVAQLPVAVSLARQVHSAEKSQRMALSHSVAATERERRRLARQLHDDVIQDLAGLGYALESMQSHVSDDDRPAVSAAHRLVQEDVEKLRGILADVYPHQVAGRDLGHQLDLLAEPLRRAGADVVVDVDPATADQCDGACATLLHRVVRELLANVRTHAAASTVLISVRGTSGSLVLQVRDDGVGFDPSAAQRPGHVGLALVRDLVQDGGGELVVRGVPGDGTSVEVTLPLPRA